MNKETDTRARGCNRETPVGEGSSVNLRYGHEGQAKPTSAGDPHTTILIHRERARQGHIPICVADARQAAGLPSRRTPSHHPTKSLAGALDSAGTPVRRRTRPVTLATAAIGASGLSETA